VNPASLRQSDYSYPTGVGEERFLSMDTPDGRLAGFLRLLLPWPERAAEAPQELEGCAVIREVHVYGPALHLGADNLGEAQHAGVGSRLIAQALTIASHAGFKRLAVIAAIGTRAYYRRLGFERGDLYMHLDL
jgi:elongator complex protein 3